MKKEQARDCNFELLRIISMLMIIMHHYVIHNDLITIGLFQNKIIATIFAIGGKVGVNIFILISGYYMINSRIKIKKLIMIIIEVLFYSLVIILFVGVCTEEKISPKMIVKSLLPVTYSLNWFVTPYIWLYIFSPFIIKFLKTLEEIDYRKLLIICTISLSIIPTIMIGSDGISNNFIWFVYLFMLAGYIRLYENKLFENFKVNIILIFVNYLILIILFSTIIYFIKDIEKINFAIEHIIIKANSTFNLILSVSIFLVFKNMHVKENKFILFFASKSFAVYLIHDNPYIRKLLWNDFLKVNQDGNINTIILTIKIIVTSFIIYIICCLIETIRQKIINEKIIKDSFIETIESKIKLLINKSLLIFSKIVF